MFEAATAATVSATPGPLAPVVIGAAVTTADHTELDQWNVPDRVKVVMVQGHHPDEPKLTDNSRSAWVFDFVCNMVRCKVPDERTLGILLDPSYAISVSILEKPNAQRYAERQIARAREHVKLDMLEFEKGANEKIKPHSQKNIRIAMHQLGVTLRHDVFSNRLFIDGLPGYELLEDDSMTRLRLLIDERFQFLPGKDFFQDVVTDAARAAPFHPVRDYLDALAWDREPRIDRWLTTYGGAEDFEIYARRWRAGADRCRATCAQTGMQIRRDAGARMHARNRQVFRAGHACRQRRLVHR